MSIEDLDVVDVVVSKTLLDLVQQVEALLQLLVELDMMNRLLHLCDLDIKLVLLVRHELIKGITALSQGHLEVNLRQLKLLLVVVHARREVLVEVEDVGDDLSHLVDGVVHVVDGVRVECL